MTVIGADCTVSATTNCATTVSLMSGATTMGTMAVLTDTAPAAVITAVMSATLATRKTKVTKAIPLKVYVDARTQAAAIFVTLYMDEFALQRD